MRAPLAALLASFALMGCAGDDAASPLGEPKARALAGESGPSAAAEDAPVMAFPRVYHTATRLPNGMVLLAGGVSDGGVLGTTEIYDPEGGSGSGHFSRGPDLKTPRYHHTATAYGGCVLIAGGMSSVGPVADVEVFRSDPREGEPCHAYLSQAYDALYKSARIESLPPLASARALHTATALGASLEPEDGEADAIVFLGGLGAGGDLAPPLAIEVFDVETETIATLGSLPRARREHGAAAVPTTLGGPLDHVVVVGGREQGGKGGCLEVGTLDLFARDPSCPDDGFCLVRSAKLASPRVRPAVSLVAAGAEVPRVLVAGGHTCEGKELPEASRVELFEVSSEGDVLSSDVAPPRLSEDGHTLTRFPARLCGEPFLFVAGAGGIERLNPSSKTPSFTFADTMRTPRTEHVATLLAPTSEGAACRVLFTGGKAVADGTITDLAEVYEDACRSLEPCPGAFACRSGQCLTKCTSELDCNESASCTPSGECSVASQDEGSRGGCGVGGRQARDGWWIVVAAWLAFSRRRARRSTSEENRGLS